MLDMLRRICALLESQQISYMLVGSLAAAFYGLSRATADFLDVLEMLQEQKEDI